MRFSLKHILMLPLLFLLTTVAVQNPLAVRHKMNHPVSFVCLQYEKQFELMAGVLPDLSEVEANEWLRGGKSQALDECGISAISDPWGTPYWVEVRSDEHWVVSSNGPDLQPDTDDDISYTDYPAAQARRRLGIAIISLFVCSIGCIVWYCREAIAEFVLSSKVEQVQRHRWISHDFDSWRSPYVGSAEPYSIINRRQVDW